MPRRSLLRLLQQTVLICLVFAPFAKASDWDYQETHSDSRDFVAGGMLHVHLRVGDLHVKRGDSDKLRLTYTVKSHRERNLKEAHVDIDVRGNDATLEFHAPTSNTQFDVELEVPLNTNLDIHEKIGDLRIDDIEGDKDLELGIGDIHIAKGNASYHLLRASTGIGDVNGDGYGDTSGWLGKSLKYRGDGRYELRAHVGIGDITLEGK